MRIVEIRGNLQVTLVQAAPIRPAAGDRAAFPFEIRLDYRNRRAEQFDPTVWNVRDTRYPL